MSRKIRFVNLLAAAAVLLSAFVYAPHSFLAAEDRYEYCPPSIDDYPPSINFYYYNSSGVFQYISTLGGWNSSNTYNFKASTFSTSRNDNYYIDLYYYIADGYSIPAYSDIKITCEFSFAGPKIGSLQADKIISSEAYFLDGGENPAGSADLLIGNENEWTRFEVTGYNFKTVYGVMIRLYFNMLDCTTVPLSKVSQDYVTVQNTDDVEFLYKPRSYFVDLETDSVPDLDIPSLDDSGMADIGQFIPDSSNPLMFMLAKFTDLPMVTIAFLVVSVIGTISYVLFGKRSN